MAPAHQLVCSGGSWASSASTGPASPRAPLGVQIARVLPAVLSMYLGVTTYACVLLTVVLPRFAVTPPLIAQPVLPRLSPTATIALLALHQLACLLAVVSYLRVRRTAPGSIPLWLCSHNPGDRAYFHNVLQAVQKKSDGTLRFCRKCGAFKPDRCHHCPELGHCVLAYEHWSTWANNAIGFYNSKLYYLALLYTAVANGISAALLAPSAARALDRAGGLAAGVRATAHAVVHGGAGSVDAFLLLSVLASAVVCASAAGWLLVRLAILARGLSVADCARQWGCSRKAPKPPPTVPRPFDYGALGNLRKVFGKHPVLWLLPTNQGMEGNGIFFEVEPHADAVAGRSPWTPGAVDA